MVGADPRLFHCQTVRETMHNRTGYVFRALRRTWPVFCVRWQDMKFIKKGRRTMMTRFLSNTPYADTEFEMQQIPGFTPPGSGMVVSHFKYSARDGDCSPCIFKNRKKKCAGPNGCPWLRELPAAGGATIDELLGVFAAEVRERAFVNRVSRLSGMGQPFFHSARHRQRFEGRREGLPKPDEAAWCAALYLLSADTFLWNRAQAAVRPDCIDFTPIHIHGVDLDGYVLFHTAKDLYKGTKHISLSELTDPELVSDEAFRMIIAAFLIRRHGPCIMV